jgi:hypothetical protein
MALILGFLGVIAAIVGVVVVVCHALRMLTLVGCVLLIVPFFGMAGTSLIVGGIALFAFVQMFGYPYYAGSIAGAGVVTLATGYFLTCRILAGYRHAAGVIGRAFGRGPVQETDIKI